MNVQRTTLLIAAVIMLAGCVSPRKVTFVDEPQYSGPPMVTKVRSDGDVLHVTLKQDTAPAWVAGVKAEVIGGDVYLSTFHISSPVHATEFAVDLSSRRFPRDWRDRLYWIVGDSISSPINPFIEHSREIRRVKITVP
jgi:hypothetical protein